MAEQLINEFTVNRPIEEAWPLITDVERIAPCLPGAELHEIEGEVYRGVVKVKLGAISSQFKGEAHFLERDDANYRAVIKGSGRDTGGRGNASANITAQAESLSPTSTRVAVTTDLHITGKVAQFGRGIMGDVSSKLMAQFADNLNQMIDDQASPGAPSESATPAADTAAVTSDAVTSDAATSDAATSDAVTPDGARSTATSSAAANGSAGAEGDVAAAAPQIRKIDGPATEPIDLMEIGKGSVLKRVLPALAAVAILAIFLRRRRG